MDETGAEPSAKPAQTPPEDPLLAPRLSAGQLALLHRYGQVRPTVAGQELFREGDRSYDFIVIVSGAVTILDHQAGVARELATGGPGEFAARNFVSEHLGRRTGFAAVGRSAR
jgi:CRP-like cAMP-binding protein